MSDDEVGRVDQRRAAYIVNTSLEDAKSSIQLAGKSTLVAALALEKSQDKPRSTMIKLLGARLRKLDKKQRV